MSSSYEGYTPSGSCTKYSGDIGVNECNWINPSSTISTDATSFSGVYTPHVLYAQAENISYRSYIRYLASTLPVIYPGPSGSLGNAVYDESNIRILGQSNLGGQYGGILA